VCILVQQFAEVLHMAAFKELQAAMFCLSSAVTSVASIHAAGKAHMDLKPEHARLLDARDGHVQWVDTEIAQRLPLACCKSTLSTRALMLHDDQAVRPLSALDREMQRASRGSADTSCTHSAAAVLSAALRSASLRKAAFAQLPASPRLAAACELQLGTAAYLPPESNVVSSAGAACSRATLDQQPPLSVHSFCCVHPWQARDAFALGLCLKQWLTELRFDVLRLMPILYSLQQAMVHPQWFCRITPHTASLVLRLLVADQRRADVHKA